MKMQLAAFNDAGIERFRSWLHDPVGHAPAEMLLNPEYSVPLDDSFEVDTGRTFRTTYELGKYLDAEVFQPTPERLQLRAHHGMWAWLSLAMMPNLLKRGRSKQGLPLDIPHYIDSGARLGYRLIVRTAWELVHLHDSRARVAMSSLKSPWGDLAEQMASRQEIYMHPSFWAVADRLYLRQDGEIRAGVAAVRKREHRRNPKSKVGLGGVRRLATSFGQFERTYLLRAMTADEIIGILPHEYRRWAASNPTLTTQISADSMQV